jgi:hypothetical protein
MVTGPSRPRALVATRVLPVALLGALLTASLALVVLPARPAGAAPVLSVSPASDLVDGQTVTITATGLEAFEGQPVAVSMCGNAAVDGSPLAGGPTAAECFGAEGLGTGQTKLVTVAGGGISTTYTFRTASIGVGSAQCLASAGPCAVAVADVVTQGTALRATTTVTAAATSTTTTPPATTPSDATSSTTAPSTTTPSTTGDTTSTTAAPGAPTATATPSEGLVHGQVVRIVAEGLAAFEGELVAVSQCGNADRAGTPLPGDPTTADCFGAEAVGTRTLLVPVSGGALTVDYPVARTGIGANGATCSATAERRCLVAIADVTSQGGRLQLRVPIAFAPVASTPAAAPRPAAAATPTALAYTGSGSGTVTAVEVIVGVVLVDVGWVLWSATRPPRRRRIRWGRRRACGSGG